MSFCETSAIPPYRPTIKTLPTVVRHSFDCVAVVSIVFFMCVAVFGQKILKILLNEAQLPYDALTAVVTSPFPYSWCSA